MPLLGNTSALGFRSNGIASAGQGFVGIALETLGPVELAVPGAVSLVVVSGTLSPMTDVQINKSPDAFHIRRNDRLPAYLVDVYDEFGEQVDLSASTSVVFSMRAQDGTLKVDRVAASVVAGPDGSTLSRLQYSWGATDTDTGGRYLGEFELTFPGPLLRTFPASRNTKLVVHVNDDIDAT